MTRYVRHAAKGEKLLADYLPQMCLLREKAHLKKNFSPAGAVETLAPGTYYLTEVDDMFRRKYEIKA